MKEGVIDVSLRLKLDLATHLCLAMNFLHQRHNLLHRDLRPSNILIEKGNNNWVAKISDFRLSKAETTTATTGTETIGMETQYLSVATDTLYTAPELLMGSSATKAADMFSFGLVLWEFLTLKPPLPRTSQPYFFRANLWQKEFPQNLEKKKELWELIVQAANNDAASRITFDQAHDQIKNIISQLAQKEIVLPVKNKKEDKNVKQEEQSRESDSEDEDDGESASEEESEEADKAVVEILRKNTGGVDSDNKKILDEKIKSWRETDTAGVHSLISRAWTTETYTNVHVAKTFKLAKKIPFLVLVSLKKDNYAIGNVIKLLTEIKNGPKATLKGIRVYISELEKNKKRGKSIYGMKYVNKHAFPIKGNDFSAILDYEIPAISNLNSHREFVVVLEVTIQRHSNLAAALQINIVD